MIKIASKKSSKLKVSHAMEIGYVASQIEVISNDNIRKRVENLLYWYIGKSRNSKIAYYTTYSGRLVKTRI